MRRAAQSDPGAQISALRRQAEATPKLTLSGRAISKSASKWTSSGRAISKSASKRLPSGRAISKSASKRTPAAGARKARPLKSTPSGRPRLAAASKSPQSARHDDGNRFEVGAPSVRPRLAAASKSTPSGRARLAAASKVDPEWSGSPGGGFEGRPRVVGLAWRRLRGSEAKKAKRLQPSASWPCSSVMCLASRRSSSDVTIGAAWMIYDSARP